MVPTPRKGLKVVATGEQKSHLAVAVLGAGIMGSAMARRLVSAGLAVTVWDRSASARATLAEAGALAAASAPEAVRDASVVITMLPAADVVNSVVFDDGVADAFARGCVWARWAPSVSEGPWPCVTASAPTGPMLCSSTRRCRAARARPNKANCSSWRPGRQAAAETVGPVFAAIGRKTVWLGEVGKGSQVKLVVNAYMSILVEGVAEALELADRLGIGHQQLEAVIEGGPLDAPIADAKLHKMDRGDFATEFPLQWALKDVDLAISASNGGDLPLLAALSRQWHLAVDAGHGREDVSAARLALGGRP